VPRILKTIEQHVRVNLPRLKNYVKTKGVRKAAGRLVLAPLDIIRGYRRSASYNADIPVSDEFDLKCGVETCLRVSSTDLIIKSPNWIHAEPYFPTPHGLLDEALEGLGISFEHFCFIDLGSGKGRVLLLASELSFRKIVGVEFSSELHTVAQRNIASYKSTTQQCRDITSVCMDFTEYDFPTEPLIIFLYNPASDVVIRKASQNIIRSLNEHPREAWIVYVTPRDVFDSEPDFAKVRMSEHLGHSYWVSNNRAGTA
jgi:SAM-dependent methyltransferase